MISPEERKTLVLHRLQRAEETLDEARILIDAERLPGAVNRIYYSVFYAANAILLKEGFGATKHAGLISLFHREIVHKGILNKEFGQILERSFANRTEGDYKDRRSFEKAEVKSLFENGQKFVAKIKEILSR
jgi:uncharacterized protein (UPF0332 family)